MTNFLFDLLTRFREFTRLGDACASRTLRNHKKIADINQIIDQLIPLT